MVGGDVKMIINKKKLGIFIVGIILVVGCLIGFSVYKKDVYKKQIYKEETTKFNKTASDLSKKLKLCESYSKTSADRHKPSEVAIYIAAINTATEASEKSNTQKKLDKSIKDLGIADTLFRSEEKTQPAQLLAMEKIATQKKKDSDNLRANDINQMKVLLNKNDFDGSKEFITDSKSLNENEIKTLGIYIDAKQEYANEIQDDADHPNSVAPFSSGNYGRVADKLYYINPQYQGIYFNEIKNYAYKFTNDDKWEEGCANAVVSDAQIEDQMNSPEPAIGMTTDEVLSSKWGKPNKKNVTTTASGTSEQWIYDYYGYVYLDNGVVTTIQTN